MQVQLREGRWVLLMIPVVPATARRQNSGATVDNSAKDEDPCGMCENILRELREKQNRASHVAKRASHVKNGLNQLDVHIMGVDLVFIVGHTRLRFARGPAAEEVCALALVLLQL